MSNCSLHIYYYCTCLLSSHYHEIKTVVINLQNFYLPTKKISQLTSRGGPRPPGPPLADAPDHPWCAARQRCSRSDRIPLPDEASMVSILKAFLKKCCWPRMSISISFFSSPISISTFIGWPALPRQDEQGVLCICGLQLFFIKWQNSQYSWVENSVVALGKLIFVFGLFGGPKLCFFF